MIYRLVVQNMENQDGGEKNGKESVQGPLTGSK